MGSHRGLLRRPVLRTTGWAIAYLVVLELSRSLVVQPLSVSLIAPSVGVGFLWLATATTRTRLVLDAVVLTLLTMVVLATSGGSGGQVALTVLTCVQPLLAVALVRRWTPHLWGAGGRVSLRTLHDLGLVLLAMLVAGLVYGLVRAALGVALVPGETWTMALGRTARSLSALGTIGILGLVVGGWRAELRDGARERPARPAPAALGHLVGAEAATVALLLLFSLNPTSPVTFLLILPLVWVAIRFDAVVTALHALVVGAAVVTLTLVDVGTIAAVADPVTRAAIAQVFVVVLMVLGLVVSLSRTQLVETVSRLATSEEVLATRAAELDLLMSKLADGIAIIEEGGRFVHSNAALASLMTGPGEDDAFDDQRMQDAESYHLYRADGELLTEEDLPYRRALDGVDVVDEDLVLRRPSMSGGRVLRINAQHLPDEPGALPRALVTVRDVTAEHERRLALSTFAGTVAHDLNSPLLVIDGWSEAIEEELGSGEPDAAQVAAPMVAHIRQGVEGMRAFVAELLAHAVASDQALRWEVVSLDAMVRHIAGARQRPGSQGRIEFDALGEVWGDRLLVRQVLDNLIGNAFKYVAPGTAPLVRVSTRGLSPGWTQVLVRDNGIGIAPEERGHVFASFHRASEGGYAGTGLGLAICKRIVDRHGGRISADANPDGIGSCFTLTLPTRPVTAEPTTTSAG